MSEQSHEYRLQGLRVSPPSPHVACGRGGALIGHLGTREVERLGRTRGLCRQTGRPLCGSGAPAAGPRPQLLASLNIRRRSWSFPLTHSLVTHVPIYSAKV